MELLPIFLIYFVIKFNFNEDFSNFKVLNFNMGNNTKTKVLVYIAATLLLISGFGKMFSELLLTNGLASFDLRIIESGYGNWITAPIAIRIFTAIEISLGFLLLFKWVKSTILSKLFLGLILFYTVDLMLGWNNLLTDQKLLFFTFSKISSVALLPILILGYVFLKFSESGRNSWLSLVVILPAFALVFALNPLFIENYESIATPYKQKQKDWKVIADAFKKQDIDINQGDYLLAFYSTNCPHCNDLAEAFGATHRGYRSKRKVLLVFPGNVEDTDAFLDRNKCEFDFIRVTSDEFIKVSGFSFPSMFTTNDGVVQKHWTGDSFSFLVRHEEFGK